MTDILVRVQIYAACGYEVVEYILASDSKTKDCGPALSNVAESGLSRSNGGRARAVHQCSGVKYYTCSHRVSLGDVCGLALGLFGCRMFRWNGGGAQGSSRFAR